MHYPCGNWSGSAPVREPRAVSERQIYRYSGFETRDPAAIGPVLGRARSVHVTHGVYLCYAVDPLADVLADSTEKYVCVLARDDGRTADDLRALAELVAALRVEEMTGIAWMDPGDLAWSSSTHRATSSP
jgi:hypothetical protein